MKREDIYTLDEELPKRVKARFVSAGKWHSGICPVVPLSSPAGNMLVSHRISSVEAPSSPLSTLSSPPLSFVFKLNTHTHTIFFDRLEILRMGNEVSRPLEVSQVFDALIHVWLSILCAWSYRFHILFLIRKRNRSPFFSDHNLFVPQ